MGWEDYKKWKRGCKTKTFLKEYEYQMEFTGVWGSSKKKTLHGEYRYFLEMNNIHSSDGFKGS